MTAVPDQFIVELVRRLEEADFENRLTRGPLLPERGSAADRDCVEPLAVHAHQYPNGLLNGSYDHLLTLKATVVDGRIIPTYAAMTLLRGSFEAVWMARWVLDDSDGDRIIRGASLHYEDLRQRKNLETALGAPERRAGPTRSATDRLTELRDEANNSDAFGERGVEAVKLPKYIELARMYPTPPAAGVAVGPSEGEEWLYRLLSGYAHSRQWVAGLGSTETAALPFDSVLVRSTANHEWILSLFDRVMKQIGAATSALEEYVTNSSPSGQ